MARMLNPVHLVLGEDGFLAERATKTIVAQAGEGVEVTTLRAGDVSEGEIAMATSPSLFAEDRVVVVHKADPLKDNERRSWLMEEFRSHGVRPTPDVAAAVLESVGSDLRELASAVSQLVSDTEGELTVEAVRAYYVGVAEVAGFDIADQAVAGRADRALASTRRALQLGTSPVSIAAALARKVGDIAKLHGVRGNPDQLARTVGMHPYVAKKTMQVARQWSGDAVSHAVIIVSDLDAEVKGQGGDPEFALENAVRRIAELA